MKKATQLFLLEDDKNFGSVLKAYLEMNDYEVLWVTDGLHAIKAFKTKEFDLCILDVMLPHIDGFTVAREIKMLNSAVPLIFLTAKTLKEDVLQGFKLGADDYITKPFDSEVLLCKIHAILNRHVVFAQEEEEKNEYSVGKYVFNFKLRTIKLGESEQKLSPKEAELLKMLCERINDVLPRELALKAIWRDDNYFTTRSMDVFITKLRKYFKDDPKIEIANIHGSGYILSV